METDREISKTLSYWLRHRPDQANLTLDAAGWAGIDLVLRGLDGERVAVWLPAASVLR